MRGILYVESPQDQRYTFEDEDALVILADHIASSIHMCNGVADNHAEQRVAPQANTVSGKTTIIRHYAADHSMFIDGDYLIKGVAGAILWKLLREQLEQGRTEFTNREMRLDATLCLPDISENLEARLILLQKRLAERCPFICLEKAGRGRFHLSVARPLRLVEAT